MNNNLKLLLVIILIFTNCETSKTILEPKLINVVGEIFHNPKLDYEEFKLCRSQLEVIQYYAFSEKTYLGEKIAIEKAFHQSYNANPNNKESGWIRIRFIINCKGEAGRFRVLEMGTNYQSKSFEPCIVKQLLTISKSLKHWKPMSANDIPRDYYQYLHFKIENGQLTEILP